MCVAASVARSSKAPLLQAAFLLFIGETPISGFRVGTSGWSSSLSGQFIFQSTAEHSGRVFSTGLCTCRTCCSSYIYFNTYKQTSCTSVTSSHNRQTQTSSVSLVLSVNAFQREGNSAAGSVLVVCVATALQRWVSGYQVHTGSPATSTQRRTFGHSSSDLLRKHKLFLHFWKGGLFT